MPIITSMRRTCDAACCKGCCLSIIFKVTGTADGGTLYYGVNNSNPAAGGVGAFSFVDDIDAGVCTGTRVYALYACASLLAALQATYGVDCVKVGSTPLPFNNGDPAYPVCVCDGIKLYFDRPGTTSSTITWEAYQGCSTCTLISSGTLAATGDVQESPIMYHECCGCSPDGSPETLIGPGFGIVEVNPDNTPATPPSSTKEATCLVSGAHFVSWHGIGPDSVSIGTTTSGTSTGGIGVSVSMSGSPYIDGDHPAPGSAHLESRNTGSSYSADFSGNESLVFVHANSPTVTITFSRPILAVGFRVQNVGFGTNNFFFIGSFSGLSVTTSAYTPFSDTAPFYGIQSGTPFSSITFGFPGATPFAFSTLEICE